MNNNHKNQLNGSGDIWALLTSFPLLFQPLEYYVFGLLVKKGGDQTGAISTYVCVCVIGIHFTSLHI